MLTTVVKLEVILVVLGSAARGHTRHELHLSAEVSSDGGVGNSEIANQFNNAGKQDRLDININSKSEAKSDIQNITAGDSKSNVGVEVHLQQSNGFGTTVTANQTDETWNRDAVDVEFDAHHLAKHSKKILAEREVKADSGVRAHSNQSGSTLDQSDQSVLAHLNYSRGTLVQSELPGLCGEVCYLSIAASVLGTSIICMCLGVCLLVKR